MATASTAAILIPEPSYKWPEDLTSIGLDPNQKDAIEQQARAIPPECWIQVDFVGLQAIYVTERSVILELEQTKNGFDKGYDLLKGKWCYKKSISCHFHKKLLITLWKVFQEKTENGFYPYRQIERIAKILFVGKKFVWERAYQQNLSDWIQANTSLIPIYEIARLFDAVKVFHSTQYHPESLSNPFTGSTAQWEQPLSGFHGNICPQKILCKVKRGNPRLYLSACGKAVFNPDHFKNHPYWQSPEQARYLKKLDSPTMRRSIDPQKSDLWSFGLICITILRSSSGQKRARTNQPDLGIVVRKLEALDTLTQEELSLAIEGIKSNFNGRQIRTLEVVKGLLNLNPENRPAIHNIPLDALDA